MPNVFAVLRTLKGNILGNFISTLLGGLDSTAQRRDTKNASAISDRGLVLLARSRVEHHDILGSFWQTMDDIALAGMERVTVRSHHHAQRRSAVPLQLDLIE